MLRFVALLLIAASVVMAPGISMAVDQITTLQPRVEPDGRHLWRFVATWPLQYVKGDPEPALVAMIGNLLADRQWCLNGWEEVSREIATAGFRTIVIEGRCK